MRWEELYIYSFKIMVMLTAIKTQFFNFIMQIIPYVACRRNTINVYTFISDNWGEKETKNKTIQKHIKTRLLMNTMKKATYANNTIIVYCCFKTKVHLNKQLRDT